MFSGGLGDYGTNQNENNLRLKVTSPGPNHSGTFWLPTSRIYEPYPYSGGVTVASGELDALNPNTLGSGPLELAGGTFFVRGTLSNDIIADAPEGSYVTLLPVQNLTLNGDISGAGAIHCENGAGVSAILNLNGNNQGVNHDGFTGTFEQSNGPGGTMTTRFTSATAASSDATWQIDGGTLAAYVPGTPTIQLGALCNNSLPGSGGTLSNAYSGSTATFEIGGNNQSTEFDGAVTNGSGTVALTKTGSGTLTLAGANTYTGGTTVNNGNYSYTVAAPASNMTLAAQFPASDLTALFDPQAASGPTSDEPSAPDVSAATGTAALSVDAVDGVSGLNYDSADLGVNYGFGFGWRNDDTLPMLVQATATSGSGTVAVCIGGQAEWFGPSGASYTALYGGTSALSDAGGTFTLTESDGTQYQFYDFTQTTNPKGAFYQCVVPGGDKTTATSFNASGQVVNVTYYNHDPVGNQDNPYQELTYTYDPVTGNIATVRLLGGTGMTPIREQDYVYYDGVANPTFGSRGDLEKVTTYQNWSAAQNTFVDTNPDASYFRYYTGVGQKHELKRALLATDYAGAKALGDGDPATPSSYWSGDGQGDPIAGYTSCYFAYGTYGVPNDPSKPVTVEVADGNTSRYQLTPGSSSYAVSSISNPSLTDLNSWTRVVPKALPDGSTSYVYTNCVGQVLLSRLHDATTGVDTYTFNKYDANGDLILTAEPSALGSVTPNGNGSFVVTPNAGSGLVHVYAYGEGTQPAKYLTSEWVRQGMPGGSLTDGATKLHSYTYQSPGGSTVWVPATTVDYTSWTSPTINTFATTTYTVVSWSGLAIQDEVIASPVVGADQHGSGVAATSRDYYAAGKLVWHVDARGTFTYNRYDPATGLLSYTIEDIDGAKATALGLTLPAAWLSAGLALPANGHVNARTDYAYDGRSRVTQTLGPIHTNDAGTWVRTATWTVYNDANHETRTAQGYAAYSDSTGTSLTGYTLANPISITRTDRDGRVTDKIEASWMNSTYYSLGTNDPLTFLAGFALTDASLHFTAWTASNYANGQLIADAVYYAIPSGAGTLRNSGSFLGTNTANYLQTTYGYETYGVATNRGRQNMVKAPDGTITRYVYDGRGDVLETWMGTNDYHASDSDPTGGATGIAGGNNMVEISSSDTRGVGGNLTSTAYDADDNLLWTTSSADANTSYTTYYKYDWRDRQIDVLSPDDVVTDTTYDNLDDVTWTKTYASSDIDSLDPSELRAQTQNLYDALGRVYESRVYQVYSQDSWSPGYVDDYLPTDYWYDAGGNLMKSATGEFDALQNGTVSGYGLATKYAYDGLGRAVMSYTCFDTGETSYADAVDPNLTGDTVVQQTQTWYDAAGEAVATATYERFPDATLTGPLSAADSYATASATWYDGIGRTVATANYGREDTAAPNETGRLFFNDDGTLKQAVDGLPTVTEAPPPAAWWVNGDSSGDTYTVARTNYDAAGRAFQTIDDLNRVNETLYDAAGRTVLTMQNYRTDGFSNPSDPPAVGDSDAQVAAKLLSSDRDKDVTVKYDYDAQGRLSAMVAYNADGSTVTPQTTSYLYTSPINASWQTGIVYPDSSSDQTSTTYDRLGRKVTSTDQRGVVHTYVYDTAGRLSYDTVTTLPAGVDDAVKCIGTAYDDMGRVRYVTSYSDISGTNIVNQIEYEYDGWGNVSTEYQEHNGAVVDRHDYPFDPSLWSTNVQYSYDDGTYNSNAYYDAAAGCYVAQYVRLGEVSYPQYPYNNGEYETYTDRVVDYTYTTDTIDDIMSGVASIQADGAHASYTYLGTDQVVTEDYTDLGVKLDYSANNFAAWDRFGRVADQLWAKYDGTHMDESTYTYDRAGNVLSEGKPLHTAFNESYLYDGLDRLTSSTRADGLDTETWGLDGLGNMSSVTATNSPSETRTTNAANEITASTGIVTPTYDAAGNMISGPQSGNEATRVDYVYDAWNRLVVEKTDNSGTPGATLAQYIYDGLNRRTEKFNQYGWNDEYYYNQDWQILEDRYGSDYEGTQTVDQYVWNPGQGDSPLACLHDGNVDGDVSDSYPPDWRRYYLTDANNDVTTTIRVDNTNSITFDGVSRDVYTAYGAVTQYDQNWALGSVETNFDGPLYCGYFYDTDTHLYQDRNRYYDPGLSTFINRDPIGYDGGNNLYEYVGDNPTNRTDPAGEAWWNLWICDAQAAVGEKIGTAWVALTGNGIELEFQRAQLRQERVFNELANPNSTLTASQAQRERQSAVFGGLSEVGKQAGQYASGVAATAELAVNVGLTVSGGVEVLGGIRAARAAAASQAAAEMAPGAWTNVNEAISVRAAAYQTQIGGRAGQAYIVNGVKFDAQAAGTLLEAKGPGYANFVKNGKFAKWFTGADDLVAQANRQLAAANGAPITWHVADPEAAAAIRNLFNAKNITGINVVHTPAVP